MPSSRSPTTPISTVYVENQPIGRTDGKGRVLLDRLRPYDTNQVSLDPAELPLDASLSNPTALLTPAFRSGARRAISDHARDRGDDAAGAGQR